MNFYSELAQLNINIAMKGFLELLKRVSIFYTIYVSIKYSLK